MNDTVRTTASSGAEGRLKTAILGKNAKRKNRQLAKIINDGRGGCVKKKY